MHALQRLAALGQARATMESNVELKHAMTAAARHGVQQSNAALAFQNRHALGHKKDIMARNAAQKHAMTAAARHQQQ